MDKSNKIHISEDFSNNKQYYGPMEKELTCIICGGILVDPILCSECENPFCSDCINEWIKKNNQCVMKCKAPFKSKAIQRMTRNIMDKVLIACKICNEEISLNNYPKHYKNCELDNKIIDCPFCSNCKLKAKDINKIDNNIILSSFPKINEQLIQLKEENVNLIEKLQSTNEINNKKMQEVNYEKEQIKSK